MQQQAGPPVALVLRQRRWGRRQAAAGLGGGSYWDVLGYGCECFADEAAGEGAPLQAVHVGVRPRGRACFSLMPASTV